MYMKSLRWALAIMAFLLAVSTVTMVALAARAGMVPSSKSPLPCLPIRAVSGSYLTLEN